MSFLILKKLQECYANSDSGFFGLLLQARLVCTAWAKVIPYLARTNLAFFTEDLSIDNDAGYAPERCGFTRFDSCDTKNFTERELDYRPDVPSHLTGPNLEGVPEHLKYLKLSSIEMRCCYPTMHWLGVIEVRNMRFILTRKIAQWKVYHALLEYIKYAKSVNIQSNIPFSSRSLRALLNRADKQRLQNLGLYVKINDSNDRGCGSSGPEPAIDLPALRTLILNLQTIQFSRSLPTNSILTELLRGMPNLRKLHVVFASHNEDKDNFFPPTSGAIRLPCLESLAAPIYSSKCTASLVNFDCPRLKKLELKVYGQVLEVDEFALFGLGPRLVLEVTHVRQVVDNFSPSLKALHVEYDFSGTGSRCRETIRSNIPKLFPGGKALKNLEALDLMYGYTGRVDFLTRLPKLKKLVINPDKVELVDQKSLPKLQDLLLVIGTPGKLNWIKTKWNLASLKKLELHFNLSEYDGQPCVGAEEFYGFIRSCCKTLEYLCLSFFWYGSHTRNKGTEMELLNKIFPNPEDFICLKSFELVAFRGPLDFLAKFPALQNLEVRHWYCDEEGQKELRFPSKLRAHLEGMLPNLRSLKIRSAYEEKDEEEKDRRGAANDQQEDQREGDNVNVEQDQQGSANVNVQQEGLQGGAVVNVSAEVQQGGSGDQSKEEETESEEEEEEEEDSEDEVSRIEWPNYWRGF